MVEAHCEHQVNQSALSTHSRQCIRMCLVGHAFGVVKFTGVLVNLGAKQCHSSFIGTDWNNDGVCSLLDMVLPRSLVPNNNMTCYLLS